MSPASIISGPGRLPVNVLFWKNKKGLPKGTTAKVECDNLAPKRRPHHGCLRDQTAEVVQGEAQRRHQREPPTG